MRPDNGIHPLTYFAKSHYERDTLLLCGWLGSYGDISSNGDNNNVEDDETQDHKNVRWGDWSNRKSWPLDGSIAMVFKFRGSVPWLCTSLQTFHVTTHVRLFKRDDHKTTKCKWHSCFKCPKAWCVHKQPWWYTYSTHSPSTFYF